MYETSPERIFKELDGIAKYQGLSRQSLPLPEHFRFSEMMTGTEEVTPKMTEAEVLEMVDKFRKGVSHKKRTVPYDAKVIRKDNVSTTEVVDIINQQREEQTSTRSYLQYSSPENMNIKHRIEKSLSPKIKELKAIFEEAGAVMEWERIVDETVLGTTDGYGLDESNVQEYLSRVEGNSEEDDLKVEIQENIIKNLEGHDLIKQYIRLNENFYKRIKEENREIDVKNANEKRAQKSPKEKSYQKKRGVDSKET